MITVETHNFPMFRMLSTIKNTCAYANTILYMINEIIKINEKSMYVYVCLSHQLES